MSALDFESVKTEAGTVVISQVTVLGREDFYWKFSLPTKRSFALVGMSLNWLSPVNEEDLIKLLSTNIREVLSIAFREVNKNPVFSINDISTLINA